MLTSLYPSVENPCGVLYVYIVQCKILHDIKVFSNFLPRSQSIDLSSGTCLVTCVDTPDLCSTTYICTLLLLHLSIIHTLVYANLVFVLYTHVALRYWSYLCSVLVFFDCTPPVRHRIQQPPIHCRLLE